MLFAIAMLLFAAGVALQILEAVHGGWPTLIPLMLMGYALPFVAFGWWARRRTRKPDPPWLARFSSWIGVPILVAGLVFHQTATGVTTRPVEPMTWSIVTNDSSSQPERVVLRFRNAPDQFVAYTSSELADYLLRHGQPEVDVVFQVTYDYGRMRGYRVVQIGSLTRFRAESSYSGCDGACSGLPW